MRSAGEDGGTVIRKSGGGKRGNPKTTREFSVQDVLLGGLVPVLKFHNGGTQQNATVHVELHATHSGRPSELRLDCRS